MKREELLKTAEKIVCGHREQDYGSPEENFKVVADLWSAYKKVEFTSVDVAMMQALLKIARISTGTATDDSFVDLAGYAACGAECKDGRYPVPANKQTDSITWICADDKLNKSLQFKIMFEAKNCMDKLYNYLLCNGFMSIANLYTIMDVSKENLDPVFNDYGWYYGCEFVIDDTPNWFVVKMPTIVMKKKESK